LEILEDRLVPANHMWTGTTSALWSVDSNWNGGSPAGDANAVLIFPGGAMNLANSNDLSNLTVDSIMFSGTSGYILGGNAITLNSGGILLDNTATTGTNTINLALTLGAAQTWTVTNADTTLAVNGVITGTAGTGLVQAGAGTLTLTGDNAPFQGGVTLTGGILSVGSNTALGTAAANLNGGTLEASTAVSLANLITVGNPTVVGGSNNITFAGPLTLSSGASLTVSDTGTTTFAAALGGPGLLTVAAGTGTVTLSVANSTYTGDTTLVSGTLIVGDNSALGPSGTLHLNGGVLQANATITLANPFTVGGSAALATGAAADNLTLNGAGTLNSATALTLTASPGTVNVAGNLSGAGLLFMDATGTLAVSGADNSGFSGAVQLTSGTLSLGSDNALGTGALTLNGGTILSSAAVSIGNNFTVGGAVTVGGSNNLTFTGTGTATTSNPLTVANTATTTFSGMLDGLLAIVENAATANLVLSAANTYAGGTKLTAGTLIVGDDSALGTSVLTLNGGTLQSSTAVTLANTFLVGGGASIGGSNALTFTGAGTLNSGATLTIANTATTTFSGVLSGAGGLTEAAGTGTLILSAANTYTGATTVTSGTLQIGIDNAIPSSNAVSVASGATLDLNNFSDSIGSLAGAGNVNLGSGSLSTGANNTSTLFSGIISGSGGLTKTGTGTLTLSGNNTYTGATTVMAGTLLVNGSQQGSSVTVDSGATLGGAGMVGSVTASGAVSPGGPGTALLQSGNIVFNAGSTFAVTLNGTTAGTGYDQLLVLGTPDLTASPTLALSVSFVATVGDTFTILTSVNGIMGTFAGLPDNSTISSNGQTFRVNYTNTTITLTRTLADTTTIVTSSANPSVFGQPITFTATVTPVPPATGTPTGFVTFEDGTTMLGTGTLVNGVATFTTTTPLTLGTHSITAIYNGDSTFATSTSVALTQTVNQASTTTTLSSSINPSAVNQQVTFTATVTAVSPGAGVPTGTVTFSDGTTTLGTGTLNANGQATFQTSTLTQGTHSITATYSGDTNFITSTSSVLSQAVVNATTTVVSSSANPSVFGQSVTFTATVSPSLAGAGTPTGTVTFMDGNITLGTGTLSAGVATFTSTTLSTGTHSITAVYGGDSTFASSTSAALAQMVNQASTTTTLTSSLNPSTSGQAVTFTATVRATAPGAGTPTGTVTFMDGTLVLGTGTLSGGTATFQTTTLSVASHQIIAVYSGDTNFTGSTSAALTQTVNQATPTGTPNQRFVTQVYSDLLGRSPDPGGLTFWSSLIDRNQATRTQVALGIQTSPEGRMRQVETLFQKFLGRQADPTGLNLSTNFLNIGGSYFQLEAAIAGSSEYSQRAGGTINGFLTALYQDALGRAIDGVGQSLGSQALSSGTTNTMLAEVVFTSQEGLQDLVQSLYNEFLHRSADSVGLSQSTTALQMRVQQQQQSTNGTAGQQNNQVGASVDQLISVIVGSDEYFGRV
jgi:autotransporter-associated beta strand protein